MSGTGRAEWLGALVTSPTLWEGVALWGGLAVASALVACLPLRAWARRLAPRPLGADESGAAAAVDFTLTLPVFIVFVSLSVQFAVLLDATLIVHYAAYSAARSARVWVAESIASSPLPVPGSAPGVPISTRTRQRARSAASLALVAASPSDPDIASQGSGAPVGTLAALAGAAGLPARAASLQAKARYAFDPRNTQVEIEARMRDGAPLVTAHVEYRVHTGILAGRFLGRDRGDGVRSLPARATVELQ